MSTSIVNDTAKTTREKKLLVGVVISDKMQKTIVVQVKRSRRHPILGKPVVMAKSYKVHDESAVAREGDVVEIFEGRPQSKTKYMYLHRVVSR
jgi:small subunit ribosomal protein S17